MKKIIKSVDKDFPPMMFRCDFCGAEFVVSPPEEDINIDVAIYPEFNFSSEQCVITFYFTHCPVCGERAYWRVEEKRNLDE